MTALGTCLPAPVSEKKVLKESSPAPMALSDGIFKGRHLTNCQRRMIINHWAVSAHLAIGLDAVLEAVELPAGVTNLDPGLADVDRDALTLK